MSTSRPSYTHCMYTHRLCTPMSRDGPEEKGYQIMGEVPRLDWQSDAPFARRVSAVRWGGIVSSTRSSGTHCHVPPNSTHTTPHYAPPQISHEGSPVVLSNTVAVARWPALARWTEDYMRWASKLRLELSHVHRRSMHVPPLTTTPHTVKSLNGVYRLFGSGRTFFFYDDVRPFHGMPGVQWERPYETVRSR